jgi:hypothetical protein
LKQQARTALASLCLVLAASPIAAATWIVDLSTPLASIQTALDLASSGDEIRVRPGYYYERLTLVDGVDITAETPGTVYLEAESDGSAITAVGIGTATQISGLVVRHGSADQGGGLYAVASNPVFTSCVFQENVAVLGGGVYLRDGSQASFVGCAFIDNLATVGGGLYLDFASVTIASCDISNNEASDGGAIAANNAAEANVGHTLIHANRAREGAAIACNLASPRFTNCTIVNNEAPLGALALRGSGARVERCIIAYNSGTAIACSGFSSLWVGCNLLWSNAAETICSGDQGTNLIADPLFCSHDTDFTIAANSPARASGGCLDRGALPVGCPAQAVETAVQPLPWSSVKRLYRD